MISQLTKLKEKKQEDKKPINDMIEYATKKAKEEYEKLAKVKKQKLLNINFIK